ncbi:MAG: hypothetical protein HRT40_11565 [Campylobacteraceae bacterium]|nr:hypothetical protein [Campylobacteraceae bacterium]
MEIYNNQHDDGAIQGAIIFNFIGLEYKELNLLDDSLRIFKKGIKFYYNNHDLYYNLASVYILNHENEKAFEILKSAKDIKSDMIHGEKIGDTIKLTKAIERITISKNVICKIIDILINELLALYSICKNCIYINFFLASLFNEKKQYYNSLIASIREQQINIYDASNFSSLSKGFFDLSAHKLSEVEQLELTCVEKIKSSILSELVSTRKKIDNEANFKENMMLIPWLSSVFKVMAEEVNQVLDYEAIPLSYAKMIEDGSEFKINLNYSFIIRSSATGNYKYCVHTNRHIHEVIDFMEYYIRYNIPLLKLI